MRSKVFWSAIIVAMVLQLVVPAHVRAESILGEPTKQDSSGVTPDSVLIRQEVSNDSVEIKVPLEGSNDSLRSPGLQAVAPASDSTEIAVVYARSAPMSDSLLQLLFSDWQSRPAFPDLPQLTSRWQLDPHFSRLSVGMWGDFETYYPLGFPPSYLSRSDNLAGDQSFANPVPVPGSEEFIRSELADNYYFLTPGLSGIYSPFGRALSVRQERNLADSDTANSEVFVTRGRGSFSNTTFTFQNYFGKFVNINADGTFQKTNGLVIGSDSKLDRLRFVVEPNFGANIDVGILYSLNRLNGSRLFFADSLYYDGFQTDNYNTLAVDATYYASDNSSYTARLSYKNDDQKFDGGTLRTAQRYRLIEGAASHQRALGNQLIVLGGDIRFLRFSHNPTSNSTIYYNLYGSDLWSVTERLRLYGYGALRGSEDLKPDPAVTGILQFDLSDHARVAGVISHSAVVPQPEMQYLDPIAASFDGDTLVDYRLVANEGLEIGTVESVEGIFGWSGDWMQAQLRGGYSKLTDVAAWQVEYDSLSNGTFQAAAQDRNLYFATLQTRLQLSSRLHLDAAVGTRHVGEDGVDKTLGPANTGSIIGWYVMPIQKVKVDITFGLGGKFRTDGNPYLVGSGDDAVFITDSYLSFDLKKFHFFFNFANVFDLSYTLNGLQQPGRSVWWGFNWAFEN